MNAFEQREKTVNKQLEAIYDIIEKASSAGESLVRFHVTESRKLCPATIKTLCKEGFNVIKFTHIKPDEKIDVHSYEINWSHAKEDTDGEYTNQEKDLSEQIEAISAREKMAENAIMNLFGNFIEAIMTDDEDENENNDDDDDIENDECNDCNCDNCDECFCDCYPDDIFE